ncbi:MAG TPA: Crp/Fnr family transcriptional regulator [Anaerolineaceae bacterium]|nr:Crp/Fnr family transcriptional regulator [Anaerolineaceae bacterium]
MSKLPFFMSLNKNQIQEVNKLFVDRGYQLGDMIYSEGDVAERLFVMADGSVKLAQNSLNGKEVLLDVATSGDFFGSLSHQNKARYGESAYAQTPVCVLSVENYEFRKILEMYPQVALKVMDTINERLSKSQSIIRIISTSTAEQRVAYILLKLAEKVGQESDEGFLIQLPLSREDIANMTALTTETVSRIMSRFQRIALINTGRQWVAISNFEELKKIAIDFSF